MYFILLTLLSSMMAPDPKLIYVGDPMCSWCYGFSPELQKVKDHYENVLQFEMIMGGLRPYNTETMTDLKNFLTHHWQEVNTASGQPFRYDILNETDITYDTEPPCRASVIVREMDPAREFDFFIETQKAFYLENKNLHLVESYIPILNQLGLDRETFIEMFDSESMKVKVRTDFERSSRMGVRGFPTVLLENNGRLTMVVNGYARSEQIIAKIDNLLKK